MITVNIAINGSTIYARTAVNIGPTEDGVAHRYRVDSGEIITHRRDEGALVLAKLMLDTIREVK